MRVDKFLKISRLIKRRTVAKNACESDKIYINDKLSKPSSKVEVGDIIELKFSNSVVKVKVTEIKEYVKKEEVYKLYEIIEE